MAPKRAVFLSYGNDDACIETKRFIEEAGVVLECRDISKQPLTVHELDRLVGTLSVSHFLNSMSDAYSKHGLDKEVPDRARAIALMAQDHTLIRRPIVKSARLITIGCDKKRISEMLQLNSNGSDATPSAPAPPRKVRHQRNNSRHNARATR
jgi:arsenate reductase-like glutaredoxin family protein